MWIDWKYALGLEITDAGFNFSVLSEFRDRLLAGGAEGRLLERMLKLFKEKGLLNKDEQRTDATHILAAVRNLNRLEIVGETLRCALNVLAQVDREWLCEQIDAEWFARYSQPVTDFRLPKPKKEREVLALVFGRDGDQLLNEIFLGSAPAYLRQLPAVEGLRQVWVQHYYHDGTALQWRTQNNFPPSGVMIASPYDTESRYSHKRGMEWRGYKVHLSETCNDDAPNLITQVTTTDASVQEASVIMGIQGELHAQDLSPNVLLVDMAYVSSDHLVDSKLIMRPNCSAPLAPPMIGSLVSQMRMTNGCLSSIGSNSRSLVRKVRSIVTGNPPLDRVANRRYRCSSIKLTVWPVPLAHYAPAASSCHVISHSIHDHSMKLS